MVRKGREVWSQKDYILGTDRRLFGNVSVRDPRHNLDHYMVLGFLPSTSLTEHKRYLGGRKRWPMRPPKKPTREDKAFAALRRDVLKMQPRAVRWNAWISAETWRLVDERFSARQDPAKGKTIKQQLGRALKRVWRRIGDGERTRRGQRCRQWWGRTHPSTRRPGTKSRGSTRLRSTVLFLLLELRSSGSRQRGLRCTAVSCPRGTTSQWP